MFEPSSMRLHRCNTISSTGSPLSPCNESNSSPQKESLSLNRMELRYNLELMQKLQNELLQMIEAQHELDDMKTKSVDNESSLGMEGSSNNHALNELLEEHSSLLRKTLLVNARRKSVGSKTSHRGDTALNLSASMSGISTWLDSLAVDDMRHSVNEKEVNASPRFSHVNMTSKNSSKENVTTQDIASLSGTGMEGSNSIEVNKFDVENSASNKLTEKYQEITIIKGKKKLVKNKMGYY